MRTEDRVGQERAGAPLVRTQPVGLTDLLVEVLEVVRCAEAERGPDDLEVREGRGLVEGDPDVVAVDPPKVDPQLEGAATTSSAPPGTRAVTVSKNSSVVSSTPASSQLRARMPAQAVDACRRWR